MFIVRFQKFLLGLFLTVALIPNGNAQLADNEARRELINQRSRIDGLYQLIEQLRQDLARLRGENEALRDFVSGFQRGLGDMRQSQADLRTNLAEVMLDSAEALRLVRETLSKAGNSKDGGDVSPPTTKGR